MPAPRAGQTVPENRPALYSPSLLPGIKDRATALPHDWSLQRRFAPPSQLVDASAPAEVHADALDTPRGRSYEVLGVPKRAVQRKPDLAAAPTEKARRQQGGHPASPKWEETSSPHVGENRAQGAPGARKTRRAVRLQPVHRKENRAC